MRKIACLTVFCLLLARGTHAGEFYFRHYQVENGLSYSAVFCSTQDADGFMWFGTRDGLNRFDGYHFKVYRHIPGDSLSLGSNFIYALHQSEGGGLWVGTQRGLYKYDNRHESFLLVPGTAGLGVGDIQLDRRGRLWYISDKGLCYYDTARGKTVWFDPDRSFHPTSVDMSGDGTIWVSTNEGLLERYDAERNSFHAFDLFSHSAVCPSRWIDKIYVTTDGQILVGTGSQGVKLFKPGTGAYEDILTYNEDKTAIFCRDFVEAGPDEYWIATESGLFIYHPSGKTPTQHLRKQYNDPYSLSDNAIYTLCRDREGGLWAGTYFGGENYYPHSYSVFEKYFPGSGPDAISGNIVREICPDNTGRLWIGTEDAGLNRLDPSTGHFTHFSHTADPGSIAYSNIHGLTVMGDRLWIGTYEHGIDVLDIGSGKVVQHYSAGAGKGMLRSNFIVNFCRMRDGTLLVGTLLGLYKYNTATDDFSQIGAVPPDGFVYTILEDRTGAVWAGTLNRGLFRVDLRTGSGEQFMPEPSVPGSLPSLSVNSVFEDSRGYLWVATEGGGLCRWNPGTKSFHCLTTADGLPSDIVFKVLEDNGGRLWVSTSQGLVCYDPVTGHVQVYTRANGLLNDQFNYNSGYKAPDGHLYFGSLKGMIRFLPDSFSSNPYRTPVLLTGFQVNDQDWPAKGAGGALAQSMTFTPEIKLGYDQSSISIDFAALGFTAPEMTEYRYMLEGYDKDWTFLKANRRVFYTQLPPGDYVFRVRASNGSEIWNEQSTPFRIHISPPFWRSPAAWVLYVLAATSLCAYLLYSYHQRVEQKSRRSMELLELEKEREIYRAKIEFFTNVAHEIRTPLTLIMGPMEKIMDQADGLPAVKKNILIMERNTQRLIDLTTELLDFRRTETKEFSLTFQRTDIGELVRDAAASFSPMAESRGLEWTLDIPDEPLFAFVDREALTKIIYNLISNAVKFAEALAGVRLRSSTASDTCFTVEVFNDGVLIPPAFREKVFEPFFRLRETEKMRGSGIGLALARSLAQLHKGDIMLEQTERPLTIFLLQLPIHQEKEFAYQL